MNYHRFKQPIERCSLPSRFTYPFCYTPHPLVIRAAEELQQYLLMQTQWHGEIAQGKMFGVLVTEDPKGEVGYLAAFSGNLAATNRLEGFVPPVYDMMQKEGFFKQGERLLDAINSKVDHMEHDTDLLRLKDDLDKTRTDADRALREAKATLKEAKCQRNAQRLGGATPETLARLTAESRHQKAEYKRLGQSWRKKITMLEEQLAEATRQIDLLKEERKRRSADLQREIFEHFRMLNARGEERDLCQIFEEYAHKEPPAGAGECAAPKLLQEAYRQGLRPVAMGEFWWGASPKGEIRHHGHFYPSCRSKCLPILTFMLQGLVVEPNPLLQGHPAPDRLRILYEDDNLAVVVKPAGMLSVAGREEAPSVEQILRKRFKNTQSPLIVHRLDMGTSGLLVVAKDKQTHQKLQAQFEERSIQKRYTAILEGIVFGDEGVIDLPLCPNPEDRPRQMVSEQYGKRAITRYKVISRSDNRTRIAFYPITGRTHQLRVHAAHHEGLNCPIVSDPLYGKADKRLMLHAEFLQFRHPATGRILSFEHSADF